MKIAKTVSFTILLLILFVTIFLLAGDNYSAVPKTINYQGYITNPEGTPLAGNIEMTFSIYETDTGGAAVWTETLSVEVMDGIFSVILGETNPLESLTDKQYYLGIKVGTDDEMTPRRTLTSVISSIIAEKAIQATTTCNPGDSVSCFTGSIDTLNKGICRSGLRFCKQDGTGFGVCQGEVSPITEICDGIDNDCNGLIDDGVQISPTTCGVGACVRTGQNVCQGGTLAKICQPGDPQQEGPLGYPSCSDGIDNDCDGAVDGADASCLNAWCVDNDGDGYGVNGDTFCPKGPKVDCNDNNANIYPGKSETCNGVDDDCDGQIDEGYVPTTTTCGLSPCATTGQLTCTNGTLVNFCTPKPPAENPEVTCNDSVDNDCDGVKDLNDIDCQKQNYAIDFSQTSNQSGIIRSSGVNISGKPITIETWVKKKTEGVLNGNIFSSSLGENPDNDQAILSLYVKNNIPKIVFGGLIHPTSTTSCGDSLLDNIWTHIVAVFTSENHVSGPNNCSTVGSEQPHLACYVNGELKNCGSTNNTYPYFGQNYYFGQIYMGAQNVAFDGLGSTTKFMGAIDDVRLWTVSRSQTEIQQCMNKTLGSSVDCSIDPAKLGGYWPFNEGFGSTAYDVSGHNLDGTIYSPLYTPWGDGWIPGYPLVLP